MTKLVVSFTGPSGVGPFSVPGVKVGDKVEAILFTGVGDYSVVTGLFSPLVLADDEFIQLDNGNRSALSFVALLDRDVVI